MVSKILVFALIVGTASAIWPVKLREKPSELAHKEGCYIKEINDVIPVGSIVTPLGSCVWVQCAPNHMNYDKCAPINDPYCFQTTEDLTRPYPDCCPRTMCY